MTTKPAHGLWIDDAPRLVLTNEYLDRFREHGFSVGAVMLETVKAGFDPKWSLEEIGRIGEKLRGHDIELVLTVWPEPRVEYLAQMVERLPQYLRASGAAALEFDAESNYTRRKVVGFRNIDEASDAIVKVVRKFQTDLDVRSELTTFTMHEELGPRATLADDVDRTLGQGYSVRHRKDAEGRDFEVPWEGHAYSPGTMQRTTFDRALRVPKKNGKPTLACGLAAYDQEWPGHTGEEAMTVAYEEALRYQPKEVRWWSSKWVIGAMSRPYASRFFRRLEGKLR